MDRDALLKLWDAWWEGDIWIAPWSGALAGLTAEQAAWRPTGRDGSPRHSIWQNVTHVVFWRSVTLDMLAGRGRPTEAQARERQFAEPAAVTEAAWAAAREELAESHRRMRAVIADPAMDLERPRYHLAHDAYHLGQIMYVRAMLGLSPVT